MVYWQLFVSFFKIGSTAFGGGHAIIPIIKEEIVDDMQWLTESEFIDAFAFGNTLPGPITTKLAAFVGFKVGGILGGIVATIAMVFPTALAMICIYTLYTKYKETPWMNNMLVYVKPVVFILIFDVLVGMRSSFVNYQAFIVAIVTLFGLYILKLHPSILILSALGAGAFFVR